MKKTHIIILLALLLQSCNFVHPYREHLTEAEKLVESHPDSAFNIVDDIPYAELTNKADRALYGLLMTQARWKLYKPVTSDSLITYSAGYYQTVNDPSRLANALYYQGVVLYDLGRKEDAVIALKKSEQLAEEQDYELLKNKLYERLSHINTKAENHRMALEYSRKFLHSSLSLHDTAMICAAYNDLSYDYKKLSKRDSSEFYFQKYAELINSCNGDNNYKSYFYSNYANELIKRNLYDEAEKWLHMAMDCKDKANIHIMLGDIYKYRRDMPAAKSEWEKALSFQDQTFRIKAHKRLSMMEAENGNIQAALQHLSKADSIKETQHQQELSTQLTEIQLKYDKVHVEKTLYRRTTMALVFALGAVIFLSLFFVYYFKARRYYNTIYTNMNEIANLNSEIDAIKDERRICEDDIKKLNNEITKLQSDISERLSKGKKVYDSLLAGGYHFKSDDDECFIDYYSVSHQEEFRRICNPYRNLTIRLLLFNVLTHMGYSDSELQDILSIGPSTVRSYRSRLSKCKK